MKRFLTEKEVAEYLPLEISQFRHWIRIGRMPAPMPDINLWDRKALDAACDRLSGLGAPQNALDSWEEKRKAKDGLRSAERRAYVPKDVG